MNAIDATSISKTFIKNLTKKVHALRDVSFKVGQGDVFGFIGPNGAGKSTTIKILMGLLRPGCGETFFFGKRSADPSARQNVGYLAENPAFYDYLTPRELLLFIGSHFAVPETILPGRAEEVLRLIQLDHAADRPIRSLSKGMVQRIGLGQTLVHDPDLYILDEPMSGLDPLGRSLVMDIIWDLKKKGKTVFFSTHIIHDVERICDNALILLEGEVKFDGSIRSVIDESFNRYIVVLRAKGLNLFKDPLGENIQEIREGEFTKLYVPKEMLGDLMQGVLARGEILSVEPERRTLEQIFLELVKGSKKETTPAETS